MEKQRAWFTDLNQPAAFTSANKISKKRNLNKSKVQKLLSSVPAYNVHFPSRRRFQRRKVYIPSINNQWIADLADIQKYSKSNYNKRYILCVVDGFSKQAWIEAIKNKNAESVLSAFKKIIQRAEVKPLFLQYDKGREFENTIFKKYLKENKITGFFTNSPLKAVIVERFIRTLFGIISKYMTHNKTKRFVNSLHRFESIYNGTFHRSIGMTPLEVNKDNESSVWERLYGKKIKPSNSRFSVGDKVLKIEEKDIFKKGYAPSFGSEVYEILEVKQTTPTTYRLKFGDKILKRSYYGRELVAVDYE